MCSCVYVPVDVYLSVCIYRERINLCVYFLVAVCVCAVLMPYGAASQ